MPALPSVPNVCKFTVHNTLDARDCVNIFYAGYTGGTPITGTDLSSACHQMLTAYETRFTTHLSSDLVTQSCSAVDLSSSLGATGNFSSALTGGGGSTTEAASIALCVSWAIGRHYRGGHPRTYLPGIPTGARQDAGHVTAAYATAVQTDAIGFISAVNGITTTGRTWLFVTVHYYSGGVISITPITDNITGAAVNTRYDSQRRRTGRS